MIGDKRSFIVREIYDYPPVLQAWHLQELLGLSAGKVYEIMRSKGCPKLKRGKRVVVPRDLFWEWFLNESKKGTDLGGDDFE